MKPNLSLHKNYLIDLHCKSINWFLKDMNIDHKLFQKKDCCLNKFLDTDFTQADKIFLNPLSANPEK